MKKFSYNKRPAITNNTGAPMVPMHPQMVAAIKRSPKGKIPPGLAKYLQQKAAQKKASN